LNANTNLIVGASRVSVSGVERRGVARLFAFLPPLPPPPGIIVGPVTQAVNAGTNVTFSVMATGAPPLLYQWRRNGTRMNGETNSSLTFASVNSTHIGNYTVIVSNPGGSVTSSVARLMVNFDTTTVTLITNGLGVILPSLAGKQLEIGRPYTITAKPVVGNLFSLDANTSWLVFVASFASIVLTFLAGAEVDPDDFRERFGASVSIGLVSFVGPFEPSRYNFNGFVKGVKPADLAGWDSPILPRTRR
jgi:hypothetical protein